MNNNNDNSLSKHYVHELIKACLVNKRVLDICARHLKYEYLAAEMQKKVIKYIFDTYAVVRSAPTFGMIAQNFSGNKETMSFLAKIKEIDVEGKEDNLLSTFEEFIKDLRFQRLYVNIGDLYNAGKSDQAMELLAKESHEIVNFSIKAKRYVEIFSQYDEREAEREAVASNDEFASIRDKLTFGVHGMDRVTSGMEKGRSWLGMASSGVGKTTYLRWVALTNARLGKKVVIFQGEDTEKNATNAFDSAWTGVTTDNLLQNNITQKQKDEIKKTKAYIEAAGGMIFVVPTEEFDSMYLEQAEETIQDLIKIYGELDLVLFDYLEIMNIQGQWGKGDSAERRRREALANKMTSISTKYNVAVGTMTQAKDLTPEQVDNPDFRMTRHHLSEFKGALKPFSVFFTLNQTTDQYEAQEMNIYFDKIRNKPAKKTVKIKQARESGRFYNAKLSMAYEA